MTTQWDGCYNGSWNGILTPESFAHPAKVAPGLSYRIYQCMLERGYIQPGDSVIDPFGGIGGFAYHALLHGLHFTGVELEPRFVEMAGRNIEKWGRNLAMLNGRLGTARIVQGDSRRLVEVVGGHMAASRCSPPYDELRFDGRGIAQEYGFNAASKSGYGLDTPGQLGAMRSGDYQAAISSPPFGEQQSGGGIQAAMEGRSEYQVTAKTRPGQNVGYANQADRPGNLAALRADSAGFNAAVSSPPYADAINNSGEGPGARHDPVYHVGDNAYKPSSDNGYGTTPGNLGSMAGEGWDAAVSSPPWENQEPSHAQAETPSKQRLLENTHGGRAFFDSFYGNALGNIGNDTGKTFWSAARQIVEQTYAVLRPGGYAVWVCKDFVRRGQRVPFSDQWEQLCATVGFMPVERIHAMLVDDHGHQLDIFGGATARRKERKSFFRRLAEKNGSPRIDHEDVIITRKPQ